MSIDLSSIPRSHRKLLARDLSAVASRRAELSSATLESIAAAAAEFRAAVADGSVDTTSPGWLVEPVALAATAARLALGLDPYETQVLAALSIGYGALAEVRTGEGKTLVATMPAAAWALAGRHVHVMTANPYLAERDANWMRPVFEALTLRVGFVDAHPSLWRRTQAYACDIVYGTASQFGFDYLNDHLIKDPSHRAQYTRSVAIIDEADALLLDDARTPLIISGAPQPADDVMLAASFVAGLDPDAVDVDLEHRVAMLNEHGFDLAEEFFAVEDLTTDQHLLADIYAALRARFCYHRDKEYLVQDGAVVIIDESTGRLQPDRRWQQGLHEALEAKEGLAVQLPASTLGSITVPALLSLYDHVGAMTGTAVSDEDEFNDTYGLHVFPIPTHRPVIRVDADDVLFVSRGEKFTALASDVAARNAAGQPVLIGAPSVADAEQISSLLEESGIAHEVLSARDPAREAAIIAQAGRLGAVTVATNMAGRGVDILLGGDPSGLAGGSDDLEAARETASRERAEVLAAGGLAVLGTARHSSRRVDDQLRGRSGRQGEPGFTKFYLSLDDDLLSIFANDTARTLVAHAAPAHGAPISHKMVSRLIASAQAKMESLHRESRRTTNEYAAPVSAQRTTLYGWRDELLDSGPHESLRSILRTAFRIVLDDASRSDQLATLDDDELRAVLSFADAPVDGDDPSAELRTAEWCTDEILALARTYPSPSVPEEIAGFCLDAFMERNKDADVDLAAMLRAVALAKLDTGWFAHLALVDSVRDATMLRAAGQLKPTTEFLFEISRLFEQFTREFFHGFGQLVALGRLERRTPAG